MLDTSGERSNRPSTKGLYQDIYSVRSLAQGGEKTSRDENHVEIERLVCRHWASDRKEEGKKTDGLSKTDPINELQNKT